MDFPKKRLWNLKELPLFRHERSLISLPSEAQRLRYYFYYDNKFGTGNTPEDDSIITARFFVLFLHFMEFQKPLSLRRHPTTANLRPHRHPLHLL